MSITPLETLAVGTVGTAAQAAVRKLADVVSFFDTLADSIRQGSAKAIDSDKSPDAAGVGKLAHEMLPQRGVFGLSDLRRDAEQELGRFQEALRRRLADAGINTSLSFRLEDDGQGGVAVGDHPRKDQIEQALAEDPTLAATFQYLASTFNLLRAAQQHETFRRAYQADPMAAVHRYSDLLSQEDSETFGLSVNGDDVEIAFE